MEEDVSDAIVIPRHQVIGVALEDNPGTQPVSGGIAAGTPARVPLWRCADQAEVGAGQIEMVDVMGTVTVARG